MCGGDAGYGEEEDGEDSHTRLLWVFQIPYQFGANCENSDFDSPEKGFKAAFV
jgi:hypothetical protein